MFGPGLVVWEDTPVRGFESQHRIVDGHFFTFVCCKNYNACLKRWKWWEVVVAQLVERSLPIPEVRGSNPVIGKNLYWTFVYCQLCIKKTKIKKKRPGMAHFFKKKTKDENGPFLKSWCMGKCYNIKFHVNLSEIFKPINQIHFTNDIITVPAKKCILILSWSFFPVTTFGARNVWKIPKLLWSFSTKRFGHNQFFLISGQSY